MVKLKIYYQQDSVKKGLYKDTKPKSMKTNILMFHGIKHK